MNFFISSSDNIPDEYSIGKADSRPTTPLAALLKSTVFVFSGWGAWSVAIASITLLNKPSIKERRSSSVLIGGYILNKPLVVSRFSLFSNIWCGVTSLVIGKLFSLASLIKSTHFFEDKCCAWYLVPYLATSSISLSSTSDSSASSIVIKVSSSFGAAISPGSE